MGDERRTVEYVASHALVRIKMGEVLGIKPDEVPLVFEAGKKPRFDAVGGIFFSLSHDFPLVACTLAPVPVGIDVVKKGRIKQPEDLAVRYLSKTELADWKKLDDQDRTKRLDELWALKEAFFKAADWSIKDVMEKTDFTFLDGKPESWPSYQFHLFEPAPGFTGAVAYGFRKKLPVQHETVVFEMFQQLFFGR